MPIPSSRAEDSPSTHTTPSASSPSATCSTTPLPPHILPYPSIPVYAKHAAHSFFAHTTRLIPIVCTTYRKCTFLNSKKKEWQIKLI
jgi:hypothetical protein